MQFFLIKKKVCGKKQKEGGGQQRYIIIGGVVLSNATQRDMEGKRQLFALRNLCTSPNNNSKHFMLCYYISIT